MNELKSVEAYTLTELRELEAFRTDREFTSIVIVPMRKVHDSGYRCMKFVLCRGLEIVGIVSGWSDVVHLNGIGGYGRDSSMPPKRIDYSIDCLKKSGCLRLFWSRKYIAQTEDFIGSDFIFYLDERKEMEK